MKFHILLQFLSPHLNKSCLFIETSFQEIVPKKDWLRK